MTFDYRLAGDDSVLPFHLGRSAIRGRIGRLDATLSRILEQHRYPLPVSALVAEAVMLTALIGQTVREGWKFSLQIRGDGPVRLIASDYFAPARAGEAARLRAYAGFDMGEVVSSRLEPFRLLGRGVFGVTIDQGEGRPPYQGITPLAGGSLAACAETYFAQSEQIATRIEIQSGRAEVPGRAPAWRVAGLMVQQMPAEGGTPPDAPSRPDGLLGAEDVAGGGQAREDWVRTGFLIDTLDPHELLGPGVAMEEVLLRLFHEEEPRVTPAQPVEFGCTCSPERVEAALAQYSAKDIRSMTTEDGRVTADCQFCSAHYEFDPEMLGFEATLNLDGTPRG